MFGCFTWIVLDIASRCSFRRIHSLSLTGVLPTAFHLLSNHFPRGSNHKHNSNIKKPPFRVAFLCLAASHGFEPRLTESESAVLPLDDEAISSNDPFIIRFILSVNTFSYNFPQNLIAKKKNAAYFEKT